jgi:serine/threonine protein kinase
MVWKCFKREPRHIGSYEVLGKLGKGGMGSVVKGRHRLTGELVAIKVLAEAGMEDPVLRERFEREFHALRSLEDPHIVRGLDFCQEGPVRYLVMELVEGNNLREHIETRGRLPEAEAVGLITQVARALHRVHGQGMIHRDVKPDNILLTGDGRAKLTDFGVVKDLDSQLTLTSTSHFLGTPNFMAPEQFTDASRVDCRCDIYSLAATLYMAVTGEVPFRSRGCLSMLRQKIEGQITPPRQLAPTLSLATDWAIRRALSPDPDQRPVSCFEFIKNLTGSASEEGMERAGKAAPPAHPWDVVKLPGKERRGCVRYPCRLTACCRLIGGEKGFRWEAQAQDISGSGISLSLGRRVEPSTALLLQFLGAQDGTLGESLVRVVRVQNPSHRNWVIGCKWFQEVSDEDLRLLI